MKRKYKDLIKLSIKTMNHQKIFFCFFVLKFNISVNNFQSSVADLEGVQGVRLNPPLEPNYFVFMGNLKKF